ncbi:MAG: hypothetical protein WAO98_04375 [Alphaproteobacteria bacterium]
MLNLSREKVAGATSPNWITISEEQAERARRLLTQDFWNSDQPFDQPAYKEIGFPFGAGNLTAEDIATIYGSEAYQRAQADPRYIYKRNFRPHFGALPDEFEFLVGPCQQIIDIDQHIYGESQLDWYFTVQINHVRRHATQRPKGKHRDSSYGRVNYVKALAETFRRGEAYPFKVRDDIPAFTKGITRHYIVADRYPTRFTNSFFPAPNQISHYVAEEHWSPSVPEDVLRVMLRAKATPINQPR